MDNTFFKTYNFEKIETSGFDNKINSDNLKDQLVCVFFWGHDCPNCEIAKRVLVERKRDVDTLNMKWYHANIYEDFELATRFGLFGIPVFIFFKNGKKLGKISPFPGFDPFYEAVSKLI
ncbi:thioredoxin family protein [bacterium]|nr:thioredoxin family protein [bacterium]